MNYLDKIKNAMKPKLHEVEINGVTFWIHRPTIKDYSLCDTLEKSIVLCVKDENGDPIFATEDIEGRVNVTQIDVKFANELYGKVLDLIVTEDVANEIEKK